MAPRRVKSVSAALARTSKPVGDSAPAPRANSVGKLDDGLTNVVAGMNTTRDKRYYSEYTAPIVQSPWALDNMYRQSWLAKRIVKTPAGDMTREKALLTWDGYDKDDSGSKAVQEIETQYNLWGKAFESLCWERLYGGCAILMIVKGQEDLAQPLELDHIKKGDLQLLHVLDKRRITAGTVIDTDVTSPNFGNPRFYDIAESYASAHWTRVVIFRGEMLPYFPLQENGYWGDSVLQASLDSVKNYDTSMAAATSMIWEMSVDILKMAGLADLLATPGGEATVTGRLINALTMKSINKTLVLDKDTEDFGQKTISFGGLDTVIDKFIVDLCGAADMPATKLFGMSPGGLNATGESDTRNYYDRIAGRRETNLRPALMRIYDVALRSKLGYMPEEFTVTFPPLWQESKKEKADTAKVIADTDKVYFEMGVLSEGAIARELLDRGTYSTMDDEDVKLAEELAEQPEPEPPPMLPGNGIPAKKLPPAPDPGAPPADA